jgi:hypothetical protein
MDSWFSLLQTSIFLFFYWPSASWDIFIGINYQLQHHHHLEFVDKEHPIEDGT